MAEKTLRKVEDQLNCSICLDTYTNPKLLQCFHVYCRKCLVKLVDRDQQGQLSLTCPICRQITPVPANGVSGLQSAFHINHIIEIMDEHKKTADTPPSAGTSISASPTPHGKILVCCPEHGGKEVELYCETCGEVICSKCALKNGRHHSHEYEELNKAYDKYQGEILVSIEPMKEQLAVTNKTLTQLDTRRKEIGIQQAVIEASIQDSIGRLHGIFDVRKTELIGKLHQVTRDKLKGLAAQRDMVETTQAQLSSCLGFMRDSLTTGSQGEVLMMKTNMDRQVRELTTPFRADMSKPNSEADMIFSTSAHWTLTCQNYGKVSVSILPDPSKCYATGKCLEVAVAEERSTALLQAIDFEGHPCKELIGSFECELVSNVTGTRTKGNIKRRGQSQYEISYQPTVKGRHQLHIKIEDQYIEGSPFSIAVKSPIKNLGTKTILTIDGVIAAEGVTMNQRGEVVVTEWNGHCVSVFSRSGKKLRSFGTHGSGPGQFKHPRGVAVDGEGNFLVVDYDNHRIQKFTAEGQFLTSVGTRGSGSMQFVYPTDIAFNARTNKLYVGDGNNNRIQVLNSDLTFYSTFGTYGVGNQQFYYPGGIACEDSTGNVFVADSHNHRIQVFTAEGEFMRVFGWRGKKEGELNCPGNITTDDSGLVYVSEYNNHRISVFTSEGQFVMSFGKDGKGLGEFENVRGLAVDDCGVVYVCDWYNNRLQVF